MEYIGAARARLIVPRFGPRSVLAGSEIRVTQRETTPGRRPVAGAALLVGLGRTPFSLDKPHSREGQEGRPTRAPEPLVVRRCFHRVNQRSPREVALDGMPQRFELWQTRLAFLPSWRHGGRPPRCSRPWNRSWSRRSSVARGPRRGRALTTSHRCLEESMVSDVYGQDVRRIPRASRGRQFVLGVVLCRLHSGGEGGSPGHRQDQDWGHSCFFWFRELGRVSE
jgi:hypothetical protein